MLLYPSFSAAVFAQEPLAAIDWLEVPAAAVADLPETILLEPPVSASVARPDITVTPLTALPAPVGLVSPAATGLPLDLWQGSKARDLTRLIRQVRVDDSPAMQALLFTLLLSETRAPEGDEDALLLARLDRLMDLGAIDPALALAQQADPSQNAARFQRWFDASLLTGDEDRPCMLAATAPHLAPDYDVQIFCHGRQGDWSTASLLLDSARGLSLISEAESALLDQFLNPDLYEDAAAPNLPAQITPLVFRLFETIGEPLPTATLPRAFAAADLRDLAGWKAQLEAAERLTHIGALHPNHMLGLMSARKPAASGGIWDRVAAWQRFEAALKTKSSDAVAKTLPKAWKAARAAEVETGFADLFSEQLAQIPLEGSAAELAWRIRLLAADYELAAQQPPSDGAANQFLADLAMGQPPTVQAPDIRAASIAAAFAPDAFETYVPRSFQQMIEQGRLGEVILETIMLFGRGSEGDLSALSEALATFRLVGLEETARRAALQLMLLERRT
ncbi:hypothetical protein GG681_01645 [Epibacterium sp. SM1969]|uniref:Uncharacterized protein n=1 Tax=Tritonibacter aquimaris TaxID=2663379 RepID=A0A844AK36_9RHOB|nr:hypothetical protein [Tritonibacter aquimaris]